MRWPFCGLLLKYVLYSFYYVSGSSDDTILWNNTLLLELREAKGGTSAGNPVSAAISILIRTFTMATTVQDYELRRDGIRN